MKKVTLFGLPFAGGNKYSYNSFRRYTPGFIEWQVLELPGRGKRMAEPCLTDIHDMVADLLPAIRRQGTQPYAIYGHSLGSLLGYLLTKEILKAQLPPPEALVFSGRGGPSVRRTLPMIHTAPKEEFLSSLREMGGMPMVLESKELMDFFEPILRADLQAAETYEYEVTEPFSIPITVMIGKEEEVTEAEARAWQKETTLPVTVRQFPGHHFFIMEHERQVTEVIMSGILKKLSNRTF